MLSVCSLEGETEGLGSTRTLGSRNVASKTTEALGPQGMDKQTHWPVEPSLAA